MRVCVYEGIAEELIKNCRSRRSLHYRVKRREGEISRRNLGDSRMQSRLVSLPSRTRLRIFRLRGSFDPWRDDRATFIRVSPCFSAAEGGRDARSSQPELLAMMNRVINGERCLVWY